MDFEHSCDVYPADTNTIISAETFISPSSPEQYFKVEVECKEYFIWDGMSLDSFILPKECGFSNILKQDMEKFVDMLLPYFHVPQHARPSTAAKILACAQHMANVTHKNHKIMGMRVIFTNTTEVYEYEYRLLRRSLEESMDENECPMKANPACKFSFEGLERVNVAEQKEEEGNNSMMAKYCKCTICLEDFSIKPRALRMPCLHLFHSKCLFYWLKVRNTCPLCRFRLSVAADDENRPVVPVMPRRDRGN